MVKISFEIRKFFTYPFEVFLFFALFFLVLDFSINLELYQILKLLYGIILILFPLQHYLLSPTKSIVVRGVIVSFSLFVLLYFLNIFAHPAQAQFMQDGQAWMEGQFAGAADVISLAFNVLRGLFLVYLGVSLVKVANAAREDEDWKTLARTPLIILITITLGDILANLII